ncbi:MAG: Holliday junction resolvase RuvX [Actinobacteria bacterium]|nr:Holliday junction resolvase RuvX [Actinomycetota bacterium]
MRVIGIDLGSKRIGVAVSDFTGSVASPLTVVHRGKSKRADHDAIARIVREEEAEAIVVGLPLNMDGSRGSAAKAAVAEAEQISTVAGVPAHLHDERLTTVTAERALKEANMRAEDRRNVVDKVAAAVLLQSWLDARKECGS